MRFYQFDNWCFLPTSLGKFRMYDTGNEKIRMISFGDIEKLDRCPLIRVHSSCMASEVFRAKDCDCADQLWEAMMKIASDGAGLIFHLDQEGRGQGLSNKIKAINLMQQQGFDTYDAFVTLGLDQDARSYQKVVDILLQLDISDIKLITNNPRKISFFEDKGISVIEVINTKPEIRPENQDYLLTKKCRLDHTFVWDEISEKKYMTLTKKNGKTSEDIYERTGKIKFYQKHQPYGFFSNFSYHAVYLKNKIWMTSEHYYQSQKYADTEYEEKIRLAPSPAKAASMGQDKKNPMRADWEDVKDNIMREVLYAKFTQHPDLRKELLKTFPLTLVEHTENDHYWGDGGDGSGKNMLGNLLMEIRSSLCRSNPG